MEFKLKPLFFHDLFKYGKADKYSYQDLLSEYLFFVLTPEKNARYHLIGRYWKKLPDRFHIEYELLRIEGKNRGNEILKQELLKKDYLLGSLIKYNSWEGKYFPVPIKFGGNGGT